MYNKTRKFDVNQEKCSLYCCAFTYWCDFMNETTYLSACQQKHSNCWRWRHPPFPSLTNGPGELCHLCLFQPVLRFVSLRNSLVGVLSKTRMTAWSAMRHHRPSHWLLGACLMSLLRRGVHFGSQQREEKNQISWELLYCQVQGKDVAENNRRDDRPLHTCKGSVALSWWILITNVLRPFFFCF